MLITKLIKNSEQFLPQEREIINDFFRQLDEYNDMSIKYFWCRSFNNDNGVIGAFTPAFPDRIYIRKPSMVNYHIDVVRQYLLLYFPTIIHELTHRKQYIRNPLTYRLKSVPYVRRHTIEIEARGEELRIEELMIKKGIL